MRFFTSMSSTNSGFKARGRAARWHRRYSDRTTAPAQQQQSPLTNGAPANSSGSATPNSRPDGPRGPRPYIGPSPQDFAPPPRYFSGPPAPGPGHSRQQPAQFHGQGEAQFHGQGEALVRILKESERISTQKSSSDLSYAGCSATADQKSPKPQGSMQQYYNQQPPPQWYRRGTPNDMYGQTYAPRQNEMLQQPFVPNKLAVYRRQWRFPRLQVHGERFRLLSYNILADYLAIQHSSLYSHVPTHMLSWQWRMNKLLFEFQLWSPDVMCLQEVDRFPDLQTELERCGYNGIWKALVVFNCDCGTLLQSIAQAGIRTGNAIDGCAIFWRTNRFQLLHHEYIEFNQIGLRDNVAQICVLEAQNTPENDSSSMKTSSNQVVVCNTHVLFNPKRGDIKLGQVRTLIDQAYAVSKSWGDAPVVLCGDFNSTPNSPLYKFISEQKLDLSGLTRNQISGQETGNALANAPGNCKFPRSSSSISTMNGNRESTNQSTGTGTGTGTGDCTTSSSPLDPDLTEGSHSTEQRSVTLSTDSDVKEISDSIGKDHVSEPIQEATVPLSTDSDTDQGLQVLGASTSDFISSNPNNPHAENFCSEVSQSESLVEDHDVLKGGFINASDSTNVLMKQLEETHVEKNKEPLCTDFNASQKSQESNNATTSTNFSGKNSDYGEIGQAEAFGDDNDILKGDCVIGNTNEDNPDPSFLSELHGTQDEFAFEINGLPYSNNPYGWTPHELKAATGSEDCTFVEHCLKLRSVYTDVEDRDGTKGSCGEPEATCYNQNFLGTVDYIWSSEGLKTVRVLDTIPTHILKETRGFPTKKWGSDHIALVCELAFTN